MRSAARLVAILAVSVALLGACRRKVEPPPQPLTLRLVTGTPGGGFYPIGAGLAEAFSKNARSIAISHHESAGSINNVLALQRGSSDVALAYADVAYLSFTGRLERQPVPFDHLRGIAVLQQAPVHLVVARDSAIREVAELRGKRVGVGTMGSGTALTAELILRAFGIERGAVRSATLRYDEAAARLTAGQLDAMFVIGNDPVDAVRVATGAGGRLLPLAGPSIDRLRHEYPFFRLTLVRAGSYPGQAEAVRTIGVENLLLCRDTLPESVVHDLTRRLFEVQPLIAPLREMDLENAPAVPIPLHEGAARFYREREVAR